MGQEQPLVLRPQFGSHRLRRNASLRLEDGALIATDRRGRSRRFVFDGSDDAPKGWSQDLRSSEGRLEDRRGRLLLLVTDYVLYWGGDGVVHFECSPPFEDIERKKERPPARPDLFRISDPPYLTWASAAFTVGSTAMALRWLHLVPEAVVNFVAIPALIVFIPLLVLLKLATPNRKQVQQEIQKAAARLPEADATSERFAAERPEIEQTLRRYNVPPDPDGTPKPEAGAGT